VDCELTLGKEGFLQNSRSCPVSSFPMGTSLAPSFFFIYVVLLRCSYSIAARILVYRIFGYGGGMIALYGPAQPGDKPYL